VAAFRRLQNVGREPSAAETDTTHIALTRDLIATDALVAWATTAASGAVVSFLGVVRDHAEGRDGVRGMTYEAYEEQAARALRDVADAARARFPEIERVAIVHRIGELELSETSVAVVVSSPHRAEAFEAARFCIDTLKQTVPIWKQEHWAGGSDWAVDDHPIEPVARAATTAPRT
jgi:molybdopterin synthase catalytic subunit